MTTLTAIADKAARLIFYGLLLAAPACGGGNAAPSQVHALMREHILPVLQKRVYMPRGYKWNLRIDSLP
jgi:hypothetical protein